MAFFDAVGRNTEGGLAYVGGLARLSGRAAYYTLIAPFRGQGVRWSRAIHQAMAVGVEALPILSVITFFIGLILALQGAYELRKFGATVEVHDPWSDAGEAQREYGIRPVRRLRKGRYDAVIVAVAHQEFKAMGAAAIRALCRPNHVMFDVKYAFSPQDVDGRL